MTIFNGEFLCQYFIIEEQINKINSYTDLFYTVNDSLLRHNVLCTVSHQVDNRSSAKSSFLSSGFMTSNSTKDRRRNKLNDVLIRISSVENNKTVLLQPSKQNVFLHSYSAIEASVNIQSFQSYFKRFLVDISFYFF